MLYSRQIISTNSPQNNPEFLTSIILLMINLKSIRSPYRTPEIVHKEKQALIDAKYKITIFNFRD